LTKTFLATLSALADTFRSKSLESTDQLSLNTARVDTGNVEYPRSTLDRPAAAEAEADLETALEDAAADEVTADGDVADAEIMSLTGSTFQIRIAALLRKNGRH
jgi:hypothetical protein